MSTDELAVRRAKRRAEKLAKETFPDQPFGPTQARAVFLREVFVRGALSAVERKDAESRALAEINLLLTRGCELREIERALVKLGLRDGSSPEA